MLCINCTFHYSVWSFHLSFCYKFCDVWHQLICWFNVSWTLSFLEVVNVLQSLLLMSLHVVLPHLSLFRCTCSDCGSFCYHLRVGLSPVFECLLHHLWLPLVLVLSYSCDWLKTRIKYLLFGLKTKMSTKILFLLRKIGFLLPGSGSGIRIGEKVLDPDP